MSATKRSISNPAAHRSRHGILRPIRGGDAPGGSLGAAPRREREERRRARDGAGEGVTDDCAWTDPGARTNDASHLASYLENLVSPGSGVTFALQGDVDGHDDFFRTAVTVSGGYASQRGQLFGRAAS